jgi:hypothetical protein
MKNIITVQIKVINRVKLPELPEGYRKQPKLPMRLRNCVFDHLNVWAKEITIPEDYYTRDIWANELQKQINLLPFRTGVSPNFGDTLIGYITEQEFGDFYVGLYASKKWMTRKSCKTEI